MATINVKACTLAAGVLWGLGVLVLGWMAAAGWGAGMVQVLGSVYLGYTATFLGGIIGGVWAFVDGAVAGAIFAWLYNSFAK